VPSRKIEVLSKTPLLASLTPGEIEAVAQRAIEKHYGPGEALFLEGEECAGFFVLAQGSVKIVVGRRLRHLVSIIEGVTFGSLRQRLARTLLELGEQAGRDSFPLPLTHRELASRLGTVREVVSRNLSRFQAEGLLRIQAREIHLLDRDGLQREAETEIS